MKYRIKLVSTATYDNETPFAQHVVRVLPRMTASQYVARTMLQVSPTPVSSHDFTDYFGNQGTLVTLAEPHKEFVITAEGEVDVQPRDMVPAEATPGFEAIRQELGETVAMAPNSPVHFAFPSRMIGLSAEITDYARPHFAPGTPILVGASALMSAIYRDFKYDPDATDASTRPEQSFAAKRGVCQDFAQVMIAGLRGLGLSAGYVSGYLRTIPPEGKPRLEGADATHAWVMVYCGPDYGWVGLDPTNNIREGTDHVVIAFGRDYADIAPQNGVVVTYGGQALDVGVDVIPI